jgi:XTP/dITP diphosphohydrolase
LAFEFVLATRSRDKASEIIEILGGQGGARVQTLAELAIAPSTQEDDVENGLTFLDNALAKARYFVQKTGHATIADDSGLMVDALAGKPGVRTKRFATDHGYQGDDADQANNNLLLERLSLVHDSERAAQYVCAAALVRPDGSVFSAIGTCSGFITREPKGSGGFGYDPIFLLPELHVTFAQLTRAQKNIYSHRARAFRALAPHLK